PTRAHVNKHMTDCVTFHQSSLLFANQTSMVTIKCSHDDRNLNLMYWYQQKTGSTAMKLISYGYATSDPTYEEGFNQRFKMNRQKTEEGDLTISEVFPSDSAVYFCAASLSATLCLNTQAYFGAGTKLTVLGKKKELKVKLLNHSSEEECTEKRVTLVCLAEDFYPDHIDLAWYIDDKEESTGVAKDDSAKLNTDSNTYSISSRLSIPFKKWNQGNTYKCKVTFHYPKEKSNDGKWTTESSTRWESLTAPKRKSLHFFTFHRW
uniref:Ig-like domain-containing protein n=1 Tax=Astyanax mexicanus TaxID=7994 RepID=A0A8B9RJ74_ASTMX